MTESVEVITQIGVAGRAVLYEAHPVLRHHAVARRGRQGLELWHLMSRTGEEVLPLFSSSETAQNFITSRGLDGGWYVRECCAGELVSLLLGLYSGMDGILLDPVHGDAAEGGVPENFMYWGSFVDYLLGDGPSTQGQPVPHEVAGTGTP